MIFMIVYLSKLSLKKFSHLMNVSFDEEKHVIFEIRCQMFETIIAIFVFLKNMK